MWKLKHVNATNIVSFRNLDMDVEQNVATLIFGQNLDNENQHANGSGKSSLIEAISFGLTGETLRKVNTEEIINDVCDDGSVTLLLENTFTKESFQIMREIGRKTPQTITCYINGKEVIQPSVNDYNKFILDKIGLTKDDIYSNYILCRNKYKSFFDCSDKDKKEIINRFSNGILVDESISKLQLDIDLLNEDIEGKEREISKISGKIDAVNDQIARSAQNMEKVKLSRESEIENLNGKIVEKRQEIESYQNEIAKAKERFKDIDECGANIEDIEKSDKSFDECIEAISASFKKLGINFSGDYAADARQLSEQLAKFHSSVSGLQEEVKQADKEYKALLHDYQVANDIYMKKTDESAKLTEGDKDRREKIEAEIAEIEAKIAKNKSLCSELNEELGFQNGKLLKLNAILHGAITCPKCQHVFSVETDESIENVKKHADECKSSISKLQDQDKELKSENEKLDSEADEKDGKIVEIDRLIHERTKHLQQLYSKQFKLHNDADSSSNHIFGLKSKIAETDVLINATQGKIDNLRTRMFDDAFNVIDANLDAGENHIKNMSDKIHHAEGSIESFRERIKELENVSSVSDVQESLINSKLEYDEELKKALEARDVVFKQYELLKQQESYFTSFKTHLANLKIEALSSVTNEYLERIGSDLRVVLDGFKVLRNGKVRDKITVRVLRDGVDCGSIDKLSAGEKTRVCLASIIALQHLTNSSCDDGKGLDLLIADEILDASDEGGLMSYCEAINHLRMTAFIITQNAIAENYPYKLIVTKKNGISTI